MLVTVPSASNSAIPSQISPAGTQRRNPWRSHSIAESYLIANIVRQNAASHRLCAANGLAGLTSREHTSAHPSPRLPAWTIELIGGENHASDAIWRHAFDHHDVSSWCFQYTPRKPPLCQAGHERHRTTA